jgi:hypothetical protein
MLKLYFFRDNIDFILAPLHKGCSIPLLLEPPDDVVRVDNPDGADFLIFPYDITPMQCYAGFESTLKFLKTLPQVIDRPECSVFYAHHDDYHPFPEPYILFKASVSRKLADSNIIATPFPVDDFASVLTFNPHDVQYMCSFVGYSGSSLLREKLLFSVAAERRLRLQLYLTQLFHGHQQQDVVSDNRVRYVESLRSSLTVLCPRGAGLNSVRFFETLSMGRIPILVGDDCMLPAAFIIPYEDFIFRIPESDAERAGALIYEWLALQSPDQLMKRCITARTVWEIFFSIAGSARLMANSLRNFKRH